MRVLCTMATQFSQSEVELFDNWDYVKEFKNAALPMATPEQLEDCKGFMDNVCGNMEYRPDAYGADVRRLCPVGKTLDAATPSHDAHN